jgi:hypothetical protein
MSLNILLPDSMALQINFHLFIYNSFNINLSTSDYTMSNGRMINWKGFGRNQLWSTDRHYPALAWRDWEKSLKTSVKSWCPDQDSNWAPLEYRYYHQCQLNLFADQFYVSGMIPINGC